MTDKEKYDFINHVVHLSLVEEDRLLNEHGGDYSGLEDDDIDSNEYYRIITERVINTLKKNNNSLQEEPVSEELEQAIDTYLKSYWGGEKEKQDWPFLKKMAIYFANWQKEQINEILLSEVLPCFMHGGEADEVVAKLEEMLNKKK